MKSLLVRPGQTRFILATLVVFYHLSKSMFFGEFAVGCFFILSGYWIAVMFEHKYLKKENSLKVFYVSRIWRLFPVFYTFTCLGFLSRLLSQSEFFHHKLASLDFSQTVIFWFSNIFLLGYSNSDFKVIVPAWSLDIELQFYILFPLIAYVVSRNRIALLYMTGFFFAIALFIHFWGIPRLNNTSFAYMYLFLLGMIGYYFKAKPNKNIEKICNLILLGVVVCQFLVPSLKQYYNESPLYYELLSMVMIALAIPFLIGSVHAETNSRDKFWGEMSFLIYLSHWVIFIPYNVLINGATKLQRIPYVIGFLLLTFVIGFIVYKLVDRPSERLRQRWVKSQQ